MASHPATYQPPVETDSGAFFKVATMLLGLAVVVVGFFALLMWTDSRESRGAATGGSHRRSRRHRPQHRFAAEQLRRRRAGERAPSWPLRTRPTTRRCLPVPAGDLVKVHMTLKDMTVAIAPGVKYNTWAFDGHGAPGPIVHVREGQTVEMTLKNGGAIPHSIDFHAARIAPDIAFKDVDAGRVVHLPLQGERPRRLHVPLRHEAGAGAHRQRDVRRDRRRPGDAAAEGRQRVRARRQRVVPDRTTGSRSRRRWTWPRPARCCPTGRPSTATPTSTSTIR